MKDLPVRKHPRLKKYDYNRNGMYFITFCVKDRHELLGKVVGRDAPGAPGLCALDAPFVQLSDNGEIIRKEIEETPSHYENVSIEKFIVMPNHIHMIVTVHNGDGAPRASRPTNAQIPSIIAIMKRKTNKAYGFNMWQDSYHDHIIRNQAEYHKIWQYIDENPAKWAEDCYFAAE